MPAITVLLVSHRADVRDTCRRTLSSHTGLRVTAEADTIEAARRGLKNRPRVLLLDLALLGPDGLPFLSAVHRRSEHTRVLLIADDVERPELVEALCRGAVGYVPDNDLPALLGKAVRAVATGQAWIPRYIVGALVGRLSGLSARSPGAASPGS